MTSRGNDRKKIFLSKHDYGKFKEYLIGAREKYGVLVHAYVLMGNHYHLILQTPQPNLSQAMQYVNGSYTTYFNIKRNRSGHLFQGRYKAIVVDADEYLLELSRYIHLNPVRANMVEDPADWFYSSYKAYITRTKDELLTQDLVLGLLGDGSKRKYRQYVESMLGQELEDPLKKVYGGMILGRPRFIKRVLERVKESHESPEVSNRQALRRINEVEDVLDAVVKQFKLKRKELVALRSGEARNVAIYLLKQYTAATNPEIGGLFGGISYSAVSKVSQRVDVELKKSRSLRKVVQGVIAQMS